MVQFGLQSRWNCFDCIYCNRAVINSLKSFQTLYALTKSASPRECAKRCILLEFSVRIPRCSAVYEAHSALDSAIRAVKALKIGRPSIDTGRRVKLAIVRICGVGDGQLLGRGAVHPSSCRMVQGADCCTLRISLKIATSLLLNVIANVSVTISIVSTYTSCFLPQCGKFFIPASPPSGRQSSSGNTN
jgi:hypothetical protein